MQFSAEGQPRWFQWLWEADPGMVAKEGPADLHAHVRQAKPPSTKDTGSVTLIHSQKSER